MKTAVHLAIVLAALTSFGVSRIGGGQVGSTVSRFEMRLPESYQDIEQIQNLVIAHGPIVFQQGAPTQQALQIRDFADHFESLAGLNRAETVEHFQRNGWTKIDFTADPCVEVFIYRNDSAVGWVATWGRGRGVSIDTPVSAIGEYGLQESLSGLHLLPGACAWP